MSLRKKCCSCLGTISPTLPPLEINSLITDFLGKLKNYKLTVIIKFLFFLERQRIEKFNLANRNLHKRYL